MTLAVILMVVLLFLVVLNDLRGRHAERKLKAVAEGLATLIRLKKFEMTLPEPEFTDEWREDLKRCLKSNRCNSPTGGSGDTYWESVVETVIDHICAQRDQA